MFGGIIGYFNKEERCWGRRHSSRSAKSSAWSVVEDGDSSVGPPPTAHLPALVARVSNSLGSVLRRVGSCGALPYAWSSPRASAHTVRACREGAGRPYGQYPPHMDPRIPHRVTQLSCERSLHPCMLLTMRRGPRTRHPEPQARRVRARGQAHYTARGDCPRSRRGCT
jgi:hypothetical protein